MTQLKLDDGINDLVCVTPWIEELAAQRQIPEKTAFAMRLCLEVIASNIIRQGYREATGQSIPSNFLLARIGSIIPHR